MHDPTTDYAAAIDAVRNAHERYNTAVQALADAEEAEELAILRALYEGESPTGLMAYMAHGKNETDRKDRRAMWAYNHLSFEQEAVRTAKKEKADAEMHLDHAKRLCTLERLRCEWLMAGNGDLLGPEPLVGRLPADPRFGHHWPTEGQETTTEVYP